MRSARSIAATIVAALLLGGPMGLALTSTAAQAQRDPDGPGSVPYPGDGPADARAATAGFHDLATANLAGYALFTDAKGVACIDQAGMGGMGIHYVDKARVGVPTETPTQPEGLVYAPGRDGTLHLAALEYVVVKKDWDGFHTRPPRLFGHEFDLSRAPNRYGLPAFYSLHVWLWKHNPAGTFSMFNPRVSCTTA
jgi:hypothetical protein